MFGARWPTSGRVAQIQTQGRTEILLRKLIQIQNEKIQNTKSRKATRLFGARWPTSGRVAPFSRSLHSPPPSADKSHPKKPQILKILKIWNSPEAKKTKS